MRRLLKRLEDLLRLGLDLSSSTNERDIALNEALRVVITARTGTSTEEWRKSVVMHFAECSQCGENIPPAQRIYRRGDEYMHSDCYENGRRPD